MAQPKAVDRVREYLDYSTVHGLGRLKNSPHVVLKVLWCLFILGSLAMIIAQLTFLLERYNSHPISTTIELDTPDEVPFPVVTICNTNPVNYYRFGWDHPLQKSVNEAFDKYNVVDEEDMAEPNNTDFLFDNDILWYTREHFRMTMSSVDTESLVRMSEDMKEFIVLCDFAGVPCRLESLVPVRTYEYGMCYSILPEYQPGQNGSRHVTAAGRKFGLELLLNVESHNSVPFVSPSNGVYVITNDANVTENDTMYLHNGVVVPTGFQADIGVYLMEEHRVPGKTGKIRCSNTNVHLADCIHNCQHNAILEKCGCYQHFFRLGDANTTMSVNATTMNETYYIPCSTDEHYNCIVDTENGHVQNTPTDCKKCKVPCNERYYKRDVSISSWPNQGYMPILLNIMNTLRARNHQWQLYVWSPIIDRDYVRDNLLTVRVYLETLTHQNIIEEYSYLVRFIINLENDAYSQRNDPSVFNIHCAGTESIRSLQTVETKIKWFLCDPFNKLSNFVSDIGGTLGLWAGFSALSLLEIVELMLLLFAGQRDRNKVQNIANKATSENETSVHKQENP